jgi:tetratricopeptide (TPR) repeat protein
LPVELPIASVPNGIFTLRNRCIRAPFASTPRKAGDRESCRKQVYPLGPDRGISYSAKSDRDRAMADFNEAIQLDSAAAFKPRGRRFFYDGDFEQAAADLLRANDLKDDAYVMLWR